MKKSCLFISFIFIYLICNSQTKESVYSYQQYRNDRKTLLRLNKFIRNESFDSLDYYLNTYRNRLGFNYYKFKAIIYGQTKANSIQYKYLDSAFMRGMASLCLGKCIGLFDSQKLNTSFKRNYRKLLDTLLIKQVDSIHEKDQSYRQIIARLPQSQSVNNDSLWHLQKATDSLNLRFLTKIIKRQGWPSAKLIGENYCERRTPDATIIINHLGTLEREYQLRILSEVIDLCKKQQECWEVAGALIFNLHHRFCDTFSEFSFLAFKSSKWNLTRQLDIEESYFSIFQMAEILTLFKNTRIEIKCKSESTYDIIKEQMLLCFQNSLNENYGKIKDNQLQTLNDNNFLYVFSSELKEDVILYRFIKM